MGVHRAVFYVISLLFLLGLSLMIPKEFDILSVFQSENLNNLIMILLLFSAYIALMTIFSVTKTNFIEIVALVILSFIIVTLVIGLPYSLIILFILFYCHKVRKNTQILKKPDPSFSSSNSVPSLFFMVGAFIGVILFFTATPNFQPESFAAMDKFAEVSIGCPTDQIMEECIEDIVKKQTQYEDMREECYTFPLQQREACLSQLKEQYDKLLDETKANYLKETSLNVTVSEFYRTLAADQINQLAEKNQEIFRLLFALGAFSITTGIGGTVNLIVSPFTSIFTYMLLTFGTLKERSTTEEIINYYLE